MSAADKAETTLKDKVSAWLASEGYPLEFLTANAFHERRFRVWQGFYVRDVQSDTPREIDVLAESTMDVGDSFLRVSHVVECKWSRDKPWVVFTSAGEQMHPAACIAQTIGSDSGEAIVWTLAGDNQLQPLETFRTPVRPGFSGRQAFGKGGDLFYGTMQSVTSASYALVNWHNEGKTTVQDALRSAIVALPAIVLDGQLFEAYFDRDTGQMIVDETEHVRIHWRAGGPRSSIVTIDLVTINTLDKFVEQRRKEMPVLLERMATCLNQMQECLKKRSLEPLEVTEGPRGITGLPSILAAIKSMGQKGTGGAPEV